VTLRAGLINNEHVTITSKTDDAFIIPTQLGDTHNIITPALIDSGASKLFIDYSEARRYPNLIKSLPRPIELTLFDGRASSGGLITEYLESPLVFSDGSTHMEKFLITRLHPSARIVLGLPWLRKHNPDIDWSTLQLSFHREGTRLQGAIIHNIIMGQRVTIEELIEEPIDYGPTLDLDDPLLLRNEEIDLYYQQKQAGITHASEETTSQQTIPVPPSVINKPPESPDLGCHNRSTGPYISLIGAAPFMTLIRQGCEVYSLQISPSDPVQAQEAGIMANTSEITNQVQSNVDANTLDVTTMSDKERKTFEEIVPKQYQQFAKVFASSEASTMPPHRPYDMTIETENDVLPPVGRIYNMSETELKSLKDYLDEMLGKGFIRPSTSPIGAPVLFARKKDGSLRLCIDYRGLNRLTKKNKYPLPLIPNLIDRLRQAKIYSKLDIRVGYNNIRIAEGHEWKTAFRTRYGAFEYLVMPFGLTNAPSVFQRFMNDIFHDMVDICVIVYLDDILIFSDNEEQHIHQVSEVLRRLEKNDLHLKPEKCEFHTKTVEYLGFIISPDGITMDPRKVKTIQDWPVPTCVKEVQSFLGFANFYRRFIDNYSGIVKPLTRLTTKGCQWKWTTECDNVFQLLKRAFQEAPILRHFDPSQPIIVESDASDFSIAAIISQPHPETGNLHPVAFHARTMGPSELNYDIYDKELLAIVESFRQWRAYLEGSRYPVQVYSDHNNLQFFTTTKKLSRRQARWSEFLSGFDFVINYRPGRLGVKPDALTRRPDIYPKKTFQSEVNKDNNRVLIRPEQLLGAMLLNEALEMDRICKAKPDNYYTTIRALAESQDPGPYSFVDGLVMRNGLIYVPNEESLRMDIIRTHHDHKLRGHPGIWSTIKLINRSYFWPRLQRDVASYVRSCHVCNRVKTVRRKPFGLLKPLPIGQQPWTSISVDHITELPMSNGYDAVMVVVCRLTKQAIFIPCHTTDNAEAMANLFIRFVFSKHGLPIDIVSDRGTLFVSKFWQALCQALDIRTNLSSAYHPETDGQTERVNQVLEQYLRTFVCYDQDDWEEYLPLAEFTYNNTPHSATNVSPFFANKGYHPRLTIGIPNLQNHAAQMKATELRHLHDYLKQQIMIVNESYSQHTNQNREPEPEDWDVGTLVWLNSKNIKTKRPSKKLDYKRLGPFPITKKISTHAYRLKLPSTMRGIHDVFHVNLLSKVYPEEYPNRHQPPPDPILVDDNLEYEVEEILDSRRVGKGIQFLVRWKGYGPEEDTYEPLKNLSNAKDALEQFRRLHPQKPQVTQRQFDSLRSNDSQGPIAKGTKRRSQRTKSN
jgi:hypothetical protein